MQAFGPENAHRRPAARDDEIWRGFAVVNFIDTAVRPGT
jgi:hypothetical protein